MDGKFEWQSLQKDEEIWEYGRGKRQRERKRVSDGEVERDNTNRLGTEKEKKREVNRE